MRVAHKLFLLLAALIALSLGALGGLTAFNLHRGFVAYINALDLERLAPLAGILEERSDAAAGFAGLRDRAAWDAVVHGALGLKPPPHPPPPPPPPPHSLAGDAPPPPVPLPGRVSLLDARRRLIAGPAPSADALETPLRDGGRTLGWLALRPLRQPAGSNDIGFLAGQLRDLVWLGMALLLLAVAAAWIFAWHLLAPLREVEQGAERLASGDYRVHLHSARRDELGDLVRHINRLASALDAHDSARRRWIADISHELRTPLAIVRGEIEAMRDGLRHADEAGLRSLHEEVMRLNRLVDDLHQLSMADLGTLAYHPEKLDLAALLGEACARFEDAAQRARLRIDCRLQPAPVRVDADRARQLIDNLLRNSVRYTDPGGRIRVTCAADGEVVRVCVDDTAPGVAADALPRLFEPLYRGEASRDRRRGGSGLGLAIAERIARAHGGELRAAQSPLGGLRIEWILPVEN